MRKMAETRTPCLPLGPDRLGRSGVRGLVQARSLTSQAAE